MSQEVIEYIIFLLVLSSVMGFFYKFRKSDGKRTAWKFAMKSGCYFMAISLILRVGLDRLQLSATTLHSMELVSLATSGVAVGFFIYAFYKRRPWET